MLVRKIFASIALIFIVVAAGVQGYRWWWVRREMNHELHPIWKEFNYGKIESGIAVEELERTHPPSERRERGPFTELAYYKDYEPKEPVLHFSGVFVIAKDGNVRRAEAASCVWSKTFFEELTAEDIALRSDLIDQEFAPHQSAP